MEEVTQNVDKDDDEAPVPTSFKDQKAQRAKAEKAAKTSVQLTKQKTKEQRKAKAAQQPKKQVRRCLVYSIYVEIPLS